MSALWIAHVHVTDEETYTKYAAIATEAIAEHGGEASASRALAAQLSAADQADLGAFLRNLVLFKVAEED